MCDDEHYFRKKIADDIAEWKALYPTAAKGDLSDYKINLIDGYVGQGYGKASSEVLDTIKSLAKLEGIILDPVYTGKAFHGLLSELKRDRFNRERDIIFIHTGGIFGLLPFADRI